MPNSGLIYAGTYQQQGSLGACPINPKDSFLCYTGTVLWLGWAYNNAAYETTVSNDNRRIVTFEALSTHRFFPPLWPVGLSSRPWKTTVTDLYGAAPNRGSQ